MPSRRNRSAVATIARPNQRLRDCLARYSRTEVLRSLLTHSAELGGTSIKMVRASWLLEFFQSDTSARLEHRQQLERSTRRANHPRYNYTSAVKNLHVSPNRTPSAPSAPSKSFSQPCGGQMTRANEKKYGGGT